MSINETGTRTRRVALMLKIRWCRKDLPKYYSAGGNLLQQYILKATII